MKKAGVLLVAVVSFFVIFIGQSYQLLQSPSPAFGIMHLDITLGKRQSLTIPLTSINFPAQVTEDIYGNGEEITGYFVGNVIKITNRETGEIEFLNDGAIVAAGEDYEFSGPRSGVYRVDILPYYNFNGDIRQDPKNLGSIFAEFEFKVGTPINIRIVK